MNKMIKNTHLRLFAKPFVLMVACILINATARTSPENGHTCQNKTVQAESARVDIQAMTLTHKHTGKSY